MFPCKFTLMQNVCTQSRVLAAAESAVFGGQYCAIQGLTCRHPARSSRGCTMSLCLCLLLGKQRQVPRATWLGLRPVSSPLSPLGRPSGASNAHTSVPPRSGGAALGSRCFLPGTVGGSGAGPEPSAGTGRPIRAWAPVCPSGDVFLRPLLIPPPLHPSIERSTDHVPSAGSLLSGVLVRR